MKTIIIVLENTEAATVGNLKNIAKFTGKQLRQSLFC